MGAFISERIQKKANGSNFVQKMTNSALEIMIATFMNVTLRNREKKG